MYALLGDEAMSNIDKAKTDTPIIEGRACGGCTLCCKVLSITELQKPQGTWCKHCDVGKGCKIYDDRPDECRTFYCGYLAWDAVGEEWFPAKSKMVVVAELEGARVAIHVDPGRPGAWREKPFYSAIKHWSAEAARHMHQVVVMIGKRAIVVFPDSEVDLGEIADDERIITSERRTLSGVQLEAHKLKADDPRIAGLEAGKVFEVSSQPIR